jgi:hypothetical protein
VNSDMMALNGDPPFILGRELLLSFYQKTKRKPGRIIFYRYMCLRLTLFVAQVPVGPNLDSLIMLLHLGME